MHSESPNDGVKRERKKATKLKPKGFLIQREEYSVATCSQAGKGCFLNTTQSHFLLGRRRMPLDCRQALHKSCTGN
jgi:hypothetical protein